MNEYKIKCYGSSNFLIKIALLSSLIFISAVFFSVYAICDTRIPFIIENMSFILIANLLFLTSLLAFSVVFAYKKYKNKNEKLLHLITTDEYININNGEKYIYYNTIFKITLNDKMMYHNGIHNHIKYANELMILYNTSDEFKIAILVEDIKNEETFFEFYNEIRIRHEDAKV